MKRKYPSGDEFHTLLFHLMHERFVKGPDSFWAPYLDSLPQAHEFHFPLFYTCERPPERCAIVLRLAAVALN